MERNKEEEEELEIKVISGKHLWAFNFFQKLCIYAVGSLSISSSPESTFQLSKAQMQEQRTPTDLNGDSHPEWNHRMSFLIPSSISVSDLFLQFDLRHHAGLLFPDRTIGDVTIPLSDLLDSSSSTRFVDYQIRSPDGKPNGVLHLSYNLNRSQPQPPTVSQISGYPRVSPDPLYPSVDLSDTTTTTTTTTTISGSASGAAVPDNEQGYPEVSQAYPPPALMPPPYPMWPPPPYWAPPGFMHRPPPPPPPGYFHHSWGYQPPTGSQRNAGR